MPITQDMIDNLNATLQREVVLTNERKQMIAEAAVEAGRESDLLDSVRDAMEEAGLDTSAAYGESCDITVHVTYRFRNVRRRDGSDPTATGDAFIRQSIHGIEDTIELDEDWTDSYGDLSPTSSGGAEITSIEVDYS